MKVTDRMIWAGAKAAYFEMNSIMHDHDKLWAQEYKLKGGIWYDVANATIRAALQFEPVD